MLLPPNPLRLRSVRPRAPGAFHSPDCVPGLTAAGPRPPALPRPLGGGGAWKDVLSRGLLGRVVCSAALEPGSTKPAPG